MSSGSQLLLDLKFHTILSAPLPRPRHRDHRCLRTREYPSMLSLRCAMSGALQGRGVCAGSPGAWIGLAAQLTGDVARPQSPPGRCRQVLHGHLQSTPPGCVLPGYVGHSIAEGPHGSLAGLSHIPVALLGSRLERGGSLRPDPANPGPSRRHHGSLCVRSGAPVTPPALGGDGGWLDRAEPNRSGSTHARFRVPPRGSPASLLVAPLHHSQTPAVLRSPGGFPFAAHDPGPAVRIWGFRRQEPLGDRLMEMNVLRVTDSADCTRSRFRTLRDSHFEIDADVSC